MADLKEMQKQIDDMEKSLDTPGGTVEDPKPEPEPSPDPKPDPEPTPDPEPQPQPDPEPKPDPDPEPEPDPEPAPEEDPHDVELRNLRAENELLKKPKEDPPPEPEPEPDPEPEPISEEDFLGELDLDEVSRDPKLFNQVLNSMYKKAIEYVRSEVKKGNELVVRSIPDITKNTIATETQMKSMSDKFYKENSDLKEWGKVVAAIAEELIADNQDKSLNDIFFGDKEKKTDSMLATEVRRRLGLKKQAMQKKEDDPPPNLPGNKGGGGKRKSTEPELTSFEKELNEMEAVLENY